MCNSQSITPETIHKYLNQVHTNLLFNPTHENNISINFMEILKIRNQSTLESDIYLKPTTTDTTINFSSNHPTEHITAAYRCYINRMFSLPLTEELTSTRSCNYSCKSS